MPYGTIGSMPAATPSVRRLRFDTRPPFGSRQHYFHFMWGYLMPALNRTLVEPKPGCVYELDSCGPVMDERIREVVDWLGAPFRIRASGQDGGDLQPDAGECVPRWDFWLRGRSHLRIQSQIRLHRLGLVRPVLAGIERVAAHLVARALARRRDSLESTVDSGWLLLRRSEEHEFYRAGGSAEKPGYGTARRGIANLEELAAALERAGVPIRIYEPGRDPLARQVETFHRAAGIVAIRGAELANVAWMRPGSGVVMLRTPVGRENNVSAHLAFSRGLRFRSVPVDSEHPVVPAERVLNAMPRRA